MNFKKLDLRKALEKFIHLAFFLPYLGTGLPAYIVCILYMLIVSPRITFKRIDLFFLGLILLWCGCKMFQSEVFATSTLLRYYFGFYIFYLFFNNVDIQLNLEKLLIAISVAVVLEAILVNTVIRHPEILPNYPKLEGNGVPVFRTSILGFYQRPYSIGNNSSITSTIIMVLLFSLSFYKDRLREKISSRTMTVVTLAVILSASGEGYMLFLLYWIYKVKPFKNLLRATISMSMLLGLYLLIFVTDIGSTGGLEKISAAYLVLLYDLKSFQVSEAYGILSFHKTLLLGEKFKDASELIIWSDFAWSDLFFCTGYAGLGLVSVIIITRFNKYNWVPLLIFSLAALHYGAMYSLPGQMLLGYFFSSKYKNTLRRAGTPRILNFNKIEASVAV